MINVDRLDGLAQVNLIGTNLERAIKFWCLLGWQAAPRHPNAAVIAFPSGLNLVLHEPPIPSSERRGAVNVEHPAWAEMQREILCHRGEYVRGYRAAWAPCRLSVKSDVMVRSVPLTGYSRA